MGHAQHYTNVVVEMYLIFMLMISIIDNGASFPLWVDVVVITDTERVSI